jgi:transcriptional regulator with XRE-family HTH domain
MDKGLFTANILGKKIERIRKWRGVSQEALAKTIGITRQGLAKIEQSEQVDDDKLTLIADALGVTAEAIKNYNEESVVINIENMNDTSRVYHYSFNPLDKVIELVEENRKLYNQLIQTEREKNEILQKMLDKQ